jgi:hypothetical protein
MKQEKLPTQQNNEQGLQDEVCLNLKFKEAEKLVFDRRINHVNLSNEGDQYPQRQEVKVSLDTPIEASINEKSHVEQELMAVIAVGSDVALGIVKGKDIDGNEINYVSLLQSGFSSHDGDSSRAKIIDVLRDGSPLTIGREKIKQVYEGYASDIRDVSRTHCTIVLKDGILTVIDEASTNGTVVFTNATNQEVGPFSNPYLWSCPSKGIKELIDLQEREKQIKQLLMASTLGKFVLDNQG